MRRLAENVPIFRKNRSCSMDLTSLFHRGTPISVVGNAHKRLESQSISDGRWSKDRTLDGWGLGFLVAETFIDRSWNGPSTQQATSRAGNTEMGCNCILLWTSTLTVWLRCQALSVRLPQSRLEVEMLWPTTVLSSFPMSSSEAKGRMYTLQPVARSSTGHLGRFVRCTQNSVIKR